MHFRSLVVATMLKNKITTGYQCQPSRAYPEKNECLRFSDTILALCYANHRELVWARTFAECGSHLGTDNRPF